VLRPRKAGEPRNSKGNFMSSGRIESRARDVGLSEQEVRTAIRPAARNRVEFRKALMSASLAAKVEVLRYPIAPRLVKPRKERVRSAFS
jgi:hypothetical protein